MASPHFSDGKTEASQKHKGHMGRDETPFSIPACLIRKYFSISGSFCFITSFWQGTVVLQRKWSRVCLAKQMQVMLYFIAQVWPFHWVQNGLDAFPSSVSGHTCYGSCIEVREQLRVVAFLLVFLYGFWRVKLLLSYFAGLGTILVRMKWIPLHWLENLMCQIIFFVL